MSYSPIKKKLVNFEDTVRFDLAVNRILQSFLKPIFRSHKSYQV